MFQLENSEELCAMTLKGDPKFKETTDVWLEK